jgi:hypothetical protein
MKPISSTMLVASFLVGTTACAAQRAAPVVLLDARAECARAAAGPAMQIDPAVVHGAEVALAEAELAWKRAPDDPSTIARIVVAQRKAQIAESVAATVIAHRDARQATAQRHALLEARRREAQAQLEYFRERASGVTARQPVDRTARRTVDMTERQPVDLTERQPADLLEKEPADSENRLR